MGLPKVSVWARLRPGRRQQGQGLIEFGLISVVLFFLIFGLIEASRFMFYYVQVSTAAQEGAAFAGTHGHNVISRAADPGGIWPAWAYRDDPCNMSYAARKRLLLLSEASGDKIDTTGVRVSYYRDDGDGGALLEGDVRPQIGDQVTIRASYQFYFMFAPFNAFAGPKGYTISMESASIITALSGAAKGVDATELDARCDSAAAPTPAPLSPAFAPLRPTSTPRASAPTHNRARTPRPTSGPTLGPQSTAIPTISPTPCPLFLVLATARKQRGDNQPAYVLVQVFQCNRPVNNYGATVVASISGTAVSLQWLGREGYYFYCGGAFSGDTPRPINVNVTTTTGGSGKVSGDLVSGALGCP